MPLGLPELLAILVILIVIFGPKRLPQLGRQIGGGLREFKDSVTRRSSDDEASSRPQLTAGAEPESPGPGKPPAADEQDEPRSAVQ